ncbi:MAG: heparinase II/III-family protein, partial [Lachnospirales bacterium]
PEVWEIMLDKMCRYMADCIGDYGEIIEFGDNDEGKILDLQGGNINHYKYVLELLGCVMNKKYCEFDNNETLKWLFNKEETEKANNNILYKPKDCCCYKEGGYSILRSKDRSVIIGIDHAELGFGSIAAHGHSDALSFQMFVKGENVFADIGTYIYHCDLDSRNYFRKTENHNTVCINDTNQSEMLGAFLWGKKAECRLLDFYESDNKVELKACHNGYEPCIHRRTFEFNKNNILKITDEFDKMGDKYINFIFGPNIKVEIKGKVAYFHSDNVKGSVKFDGKAEIVNKKYSPCYGIIENCLGLSIKNDCLKAETVIEIC